MADTSLPRTFIKYPQASFNDRLMVWLSRYWIGLFALFYGIYVGLPFLAPALMHLGWVGPGKVIYLVYSFLCHQLPERSYFFFGSRVSYSLSDIQAAWQNTDNPMVLRQFTGSPSMGWKMAWSDRMVSMYTSIWLFSLIWWPLRKRIKPLPWWGLALFLLPMAVDGTTHLFSDLQGFGQGFRDTNLWLAVLTRNAFPAAFYAGDALGSFNSWMRILTGFLFGLGLVWFAFPYINAAFKDAADFAEKKLTYARAQNEQFQLLETDRQ